MRKFVVLAAACTWAAFATTGACGDAPAAGLRILSTNALQGALESLPADFAPGGSEPVQREFAATAALVRRLQEGEVADVFIGTRSAIDELLAAGKARRGSDVNLARSRIGLAVRQGAARPDISTPDALRRALLAARSISYTDPASGAISGVHFHGVLDSLGIAEAMKARTRHPPAGGFSARLLVSGEADLAIQQIAELQTVPGIEVVGPLPDALQKVTLFAAAVPATARRPEAGQAYIRQLQSPSGAAVMRAQGLEPVATGAVSPR